MEDAEIIDLYWSRSETAIAETAKKYGGYCRSIAWRILQNEGDSEECVNDTWLGAWASMPPHRPSVLSTFLGRITRNLAINRYKEQRAQKRGAGQIAVALEELQECVPTPNGVETALDRMALAEVLDRFIGSLPKERRVIFIQRYWYLCSIREIAERCGVNAGKVKVTLHRARRELRDILREEGIRL